VVVVVHVKITTEQPLKVITTKKSCKQTSPKYTTKIFTSHGWISLFF